MRSIVGTVVLALVLGVVGWVLWSSAARQERLAAAERDLVSFQFERAAAAFDELAEPAPFTSLVPFLDVASTASEARVAGSYWQSQYDQVASTPDAAMLAANAAFRAAERDGGVPAAVVAKLDGVVKRYGDILRADPDNEDAAYNFELAVRRRAVLATSKQVIAPADPALAGRTLHGRVGAPPEAADMKQFKMIVPMLPQEREEAEQAGRGATRPRKG